MTFRTSLMEVMKRCSHLLGCQSLPLGPPDMDTAGVRGQKSNAGVNKAASAKVSRAAMRRAAKAQEEEAMDEVEEEATQVLPDEELE